MQLKVKKLTPDAKLPSQAHLGDLFDVFSNENITLNSYEAQIVHLGIALDIPSGYRVKVFARSSLSKKNNIIVSNSVGIIDTGYKDEVGLICHTIPNTQNDTLQNRIVEIKKGDKIAQIQLEKIEEFEIIEVQELNKSNDRGGGVGSTGEK